MPQPAVFCFHSEVESQGWTGNSCRGEPKSPDPLATIAAGALTMAMSSGYDTLLVEHFCANIVCPVVKIYAKAAELSGSSPKEGLSGLALAPVTEDLSGSETVVSIR